MSLITTVTTGQTRPPKDSTIDVQNMAFPDLLRTLSRIYNVGVCNPKNLKGTPVSGGFFKHTPLMDIIISVNRIELSVHVYMAYQDKVIYVGDRPFPKPFVPSPQQWPCSKL